MAHKTHEDRTEEQNLTRLKTGHTNLKSLVVKYGLSSEEYFTESHRHPFLIQTTGFKDKSAETRRNELMECPVFYLKKVSRDGDQSKMTVGRNPSCDIYIGDNRISSAHSYFEKKEAGWIIADAKSRNGTYVKDKRLDPFSECPLRSPTEIKFSKRISLVFVDAKTIFSYIIELYNSPR